MTRPRRIRRAIVAAATMMMVLLLIHPAAAEWPTNGRPVAIGAGYQNLQVLVADGPDAFFLGWTDESSGRVLVQRVLADGKITPGWAVGGVQSPTGPNMTRANIKVVPDGTGGCFVAWDVGSQHVGTPEG